MLYELIEIKNGKETMVMRDNYQKVCSRKRVLVDSQRKTKVSFDIRETESNEKYMRKHKFRSH